MIFNKPQRTNITTRLVDEQLSKYIQEKDITFRERHLQTATKLSTMNFELIPSTANIKDFIGSMTSDYQHLVDYASQRLSGDLQRLKGNSEILNTKESEIELTRKINEVKAKMTPLTGKFDDQGKRFKTKVLRWFYRYVPLLIIIAGMEFISNFDAMNMGGSRLSSLGIAILAGISMYWYAHFAPEKIQKYGGDSIRKKILLFTLFLLPIVAVFYFFSSMRLQYLAVLNPEQFEMFKTSPYSMTITNVFAFVISYWIIAANKPDKETILAYKKYINDVKEIKVLEFQLEKLKSEMSSLNPKLREKLEDRYNILLLGKQIEDEITTRLRSSFEEFKMELFLKSNGACSKLFSGNPNVDIPSLNTNFGSINQNFESR